MAYTIRVGKMVGLALTREEAGAEAKRLDRGRWTRPTRKFFPNRYTPVVVTTPDGARWALCDGVWTELIWQHALVDGIPTIEEEDEDA